MRHEVYREACERADSDFSGVLVELERLRLRKEQVERALEALKSFVDSGAPTIPVEQQIDVDLPTPATAVEQQIDVDLLTPALPVEPQVEYAEPEPVVAVQQAQPASDLTPSPVQSAVTQSLDPLQRLIDDAIWGNSQSLKPKGKLQAA